MFRESSCTSSGAYQMQEPHLVYRWNVVVAVLLVVIGLVRPTTTNNTATTRSIGKPDAPAAFDKLLIMGMRMAETCWAVFKPQAINLRD
jgi:hypothetical protein